MACFSAGREMKFDLDRYKLLGLLVLADLVFIFLHILHVYTPLLPENLYSLSRDRGYAEFFQYTKELWIAVLFLVAGLKHRRLLYLVISFLFAYFLFDDSFEFHEQFGALLAGTLHLQPLFGLRNVDIGELLVSAIFGGLFIAALGIAYTISSPVSRRVARNLVLLLVFIALFGVLLDMVEVVVENQVLSEILKIFEEGGEMLVMSLIAWFAFRLDSHG
jgi:hypothetical protein